MRLNNKKGQGLIEYLILVALLGVSAIGITRVLGKTLKARFAEVTYALDGQEKDFTDIKINQKLIRKSDLGNFMKGAASADRNNGSGQ